MTNIIRRYKANIVSNQKISSFIDPGKSSAVINENNPGSENLTTEGCKLRRSSSVSQNKIFFDYQGNAVISHIPYITMLYSMMDPRSGKFIPRRGVFELLEKFGFKVPCMKGINPLNYIHYKKVTQIINSFRISNHSLQSLSLINI